ncbi:alpha-keto acid decarboxylase family protein [Actinacidiphila oryziradicis]|uniref:alpha-keto acid decarboxylase family protein n=1 Tax=Actinacidiphila oryziradicis TaxID=2571141 RepID=UPI001B80AC64|nr:thiamine pyrophosphate-binding protein [Actinacidiphila oryziradicis]
MSHTSPPSISCYLLDRIAALGVRHVFGVPGDYNLTFLDAIEAHPQLRWVGNANELNAYMADGYARVNGFAVLVTTYGVGELSAINGIAGAYAENVPVLHIAGTPTTDIQRRGLPVHHSLLDGDHRHFVRAAREVTHAAASLGAADAAEAIDRVIAAVLTEKKPGYLALPSDLVHRPCPAPANPTTPPAPRDSTPARAFADSAARLLRDARTVTVLVDALAQRHGAGERLDELIRKGQLAAAVTTSGKGVLDESADTFAGLYIGSISAPEVRAAVEEADVVIGVGLVEHDLNTGGFTTRIDPARLIGIQPSYTTVGPLRIDHLTMDQALDELRGLVAPAQAPSPTPVTIPAPQPTDPATPLTQDLLWQRIGDFLKPGDIIAADQGTPFYGLLGQRLPSGVEIIAQPGWSSIGYALPAIAGAQLAAELRRRGILLIGDGAAQLSIQEIGILARENLDPIIVLVNNDGYTVERAINGPNATYNDIPR